MSHEEFKKMLVDAGFDPRDEQESYEANRPYMSVFEGHILVRACADGRFEFGDAFEDDESKMTAYYDTADEVITRLKNFVDPV